MGLKVCHLLVWAAFLFLNTYLSNLYLQCGAQTHHLEIKSCMFLWLSQPGTSGLVFLSYTCLRDHFEFWILNNESLGWINCELVSLFFLCMNFLYRIMTDATYFSCTLDNYKKIKILEPIIEIWQLLPR